MTSLRRSRTQIESDFESIVSIVRNHPHHLLSEIDIKTACMFFAGYDAAFQGIPLHGFYHWLVARGDADKRPRHWIQNLQRLARKKTGSTASPSTILDNGCKILKRFLAYRRRHGVQTVIADAMEIRKHQIEGQARRELLATGRAKAALRLPLIKTPRRT